jgi:hypothetical protein
VQQSAAGGGVLPMLLQVLSWLGGSAAHAAVLQVLSWLGGGAARRGEVLQMLLSKCRSCQACCPSAEDAAGCCPAAVQAWSVLGEAAGCCPCGAHAVHLVLGGVEVLQEAWKCCRRRGMGQKKLRETVPDFRDAPTTKIKTAISFSIHL